MKESSTGLQLLGFGSRTGRTSIVANQPNANMGSYHRHRHRTSPLLLLSVALLFLLPPTAPSRELRWEEDKPSCCTFTPEPSNNNPSTTPGRVVVSSVVVSSTDDAAKLQKDLLCCPGAVFEVEWQGLVGISNSLDVAGGTSLKITVRSAKAPVCRHFCDNYIRCYCRRLPSFPTLCCVKIATKYKSVGSAVLRSFAVHALAGA